MSIGEHVHIFDNGRPINCIITEFMMGGATAIMTDSRGYGRYTRPVSTISKGWLMLGADASSSGIGLS